MPRRSGGSSRSSSPKRSAPTQQAPTRTPVQTQTRPVPTQTTGSGMGSGLMGTMAQGMAFGAGSEVAHQAMRSMFGGGSHQQSAQDQAQPQEGVSQQQQTQPKYCEMENFDFVNCLKTNSSAIDYCQSYLDMLKDCEKRVSSKEKTSQW